MDVDFIDAVKLLPINDRIKAVALSHHLDKWAQDDAEVQKKIHSLRVQHLKDMIPLQKEINLIIQGKRAPNPEELKDLATYNIQAVDCTLEPIDSFWCKVLQNNSLISKLTTPEDIQILKHLTSIEVELGDNGKDYKLLFQFSANEYFDECVLTKQYVFNETEEQEDDAPEKCVGSKINWKQGRNITKKIVKNKQKNKKTGQERIVEKEENAASFFHFFDNLEQIEQEEIRDDRLEFDYQLGNTFLHKIIPDALGYYLGVKKDESDFDEDEEEDDEDCDEEDDDDQ